MPDPGTGDLVRATIQYQLQASPASLFVNHAYFQVNGVLGNTIPAAVAAKAVKNNWFAFWGSYMSVAVAIKRVSLQWAQPNGQADGAIDSDDALLVGLKNGETVPFQNTALIRCHSSFVGKHGRGRFYFPGIVKTDVLGNSFTSTAMTELTGVCNLLLTSPITESESGVPFPTGGSLQLWRVTVDATNTYRDYGEVITVTPDSIVRAQRRRQPDRGV